MWLADEEKANSSKYISTLWLRVTHGAQPTWHSRIFLADALAAVKYSPTTYTHRVRSNLMQLPVLYPIFVVIVAIFLFLLGGFHEPSVTASPDTYFGDGARVQT